MNHALKPLQFTTSMYRLAAYTVEKQIECLSMTYKLATAANPMFLSRDFVLRRETPVDVTRPAARPKPAKPATRRNAPRAVANPTPAAISKPAVAKTPAAAPEPAKLAKPVEAAKPVTPQADDAISPAIRKPRAPSKPPAMPDRKYDA